MANAINYLINRIKREIPISILNLAFVKTIPINTVQLSLDYLIHDNVINKVLMDDLNLIGGIESIIDISNCHITPITMGQIIDVGLGPTGGKEISSVLSVGYGYNAMAGGMPGIVSALTEPYQTCDARCQLISKNIIYVEGYVGVSMTNARVVYAHDSELTDIAQRSLIPLGALTVLAAKMIIHTKLILDLHNAQVIAGVDMGAIMDIVGGYSDSATMYLESLEKWQKINFLGDRVTQNRLIRMCMPT